jgi:hypothetical protein
VGFEARIAIWGRRRSMKTDEGGEFLMKKKFL